MLESALADGRGVLVIVGLVVVEAICWALYWRRTRHGPPPREWLATLLSGVCLMLAVRAALRDEPTVHVAGWLLAAGVTHVVDVMSRFGSRRRA